MDPPLQYWTNVDPNMSKWIDCGCPKQKDPIEFNVLTLTKENRTAMANEANEPILGNLDLIKNTDDNVKIIPHGMLEAMHFYTKVLSEKDEAKAAALELTPLECETATA